jgi:hypothetical protein
MTRPSHEPWPPYGQDIHSLLDQREQASEIRILADRVNAVGLSLSAISRRVDRGNERMRTMEQDTAEKIKALESRVDRLVEIAKWAAFASMMLAGAWEKLPEPLRARLLGG